MTRANLQSISRCIRLEFKVVVANPGTQILLLCRSNHLVGPYLIINMELYITKDDHYERKHLLRIQCHDYT